MPIEPGATLYDDEKRLDNDELLLEILRPLLRII
jgi:hypothetical protein